MAALDDIDRVDLHITQMRDRRERGGGPFTERGRAIEPLRRDPQMAGTILLENDGRFGQGQDSVWVGPSLEAIRADRQPVSAAPCPRASGTCYYNPADGFKIAQARRPDPSPYKASLFHRTMWPRIRVVLRSMLTVC